MLELLRSGDEAAFTELYRRYWDRLYVISSHTLGSYQEAEEAVHDVFLKIWKMRGTIVIRQSLQQYLAVAVKYEVISRLRKQHRRRQLFDRFGPEAVVADDPTGEFLREKELIAELETTIRALPEKCRIVFRLSREQGYSHREIAAELGVSENTIESHISRALHTLRSHFQRLLFYFEKIFFPAHGTPPLAASISGKAYFAMKEEPTYDIRELAAKWMDGTITQEERVYFEAWCNRFDFSELELRDHWAGRPGEIEGHILQKLQASLRASEKGPVAHIHSPGPARWWAAAASVLLLITAGAYFLYSRNKQVTDHAKIAGQGLAGDVAPGRYGAVLTLANGSKIILDSTGNGNIAVQGSSEVLMQNGRVVYNTITTPRGRQYQLVLPDGSRVWLNAASVIRYPTAFAGNVRAVELSGEAYFDIAQNDAKPFVVSSGGMRVQVLGTEFNLMAYPDEASVNTTLVHGAVKVINDRNSLLLQPDEQASLPASAARFTVSKPNMKEVLAWKEGRFRFDGANITTIMRQIARWYDVDIEYRGKIPPGEFNGSLTRAEYALKILHALERAGNVHFSIEGRKIVVMAGPR